MKHLILSVVLSTTISTATFAGLGEYDGGVDNSNTSISTFYGLLITPGINTTISLMLKDMQTKAELAQILEVQVEEYYLSEGIVTGEELALITEDEGMCKEDKALLMSDIEAWIDANLPIED